MSEEMKWTHTLPTVPGAYWYRDKHRDDGPRVIMIRDYAGRMAWDNATLDGRYFSGSEWAGPIPPPLESEARDG
jgi:hypothetical protein